MGTTRSIKVKMKVTIYTPVFGNYDPEPYPVEHLHRENVEFTWITDDLVNDNGWDVYLIDTEDADKWQIAKCNRAYKLQPHKMHGPRLHLDSSDINVYIDGNKQLFDIDKLLEYCERLYNNPDIDAYFYNHEHRTTVRQELKEVIDWRRDDPAKVKKQFTEYWKEGFRDDIPLCVASVQIRKTHAPELQKFLDCWWNEVQNKSYRDQISWPYAIWKTGFDRFERLDVKTERFNMIKNVSHKKVIQC